MKVVVPGRVDPFFVQFQHRHNKRKTRIVETQCTVEIDGISYRGWARCSPCDRHVFSRGYGRRLALRRALDKCRSIQREDRAQIWQTYFERCRDLPNHRGSTSPTEEEVVTTLQGPVLRITRHDGQIVAVETLAP